MMPCEHRRINMKTTCIPSVLSGLIIGAVLLPVTTVALENNVLGEIPRPEHAQSFLFSVGFVLLLVGAFLGAVSLAARFFSPERPRKAANICLLGGAAAGGLLVLHLSELKSWADVMQFGLPFYLLAVLWIAALFAWGCRLKLQAERKPVGQ